MILALEVNPTQFFPLYSEGIFSFIFSDDISFIKSFSLSWAIFSAPTVKNTSADVLSPSLAILSISSSLFPSTKFTFIPVSDSKSLNNCLSIS